MASIPTTPLQRVLCVVVVIQYSSFPFPEIMRIVLAHCATHRRLSVKEVGEVRRAIVFRPFKVNMWWSISNGDGGRRHERTLLF